MAILSWNDYKYYFDYDQQPTVGEVNSLYQSDKGYLYVTQLFSEAPEQVGNFLTGYSTSTLLYTEFAKFIHGRTAWVSTGPEEKMWQDYSTSFPDEMQATIFQMTKELRKTQSWSTFVSSSYTEIINFFNSYYDHKKEIVYSFSKFLIRKANEMSGVWINTEKQYQGSEQIQIIEFNDFLYNSPYFWRYYSAPDRRFEKITSMIPSQLADYLAQYIKYYFIGGNRYFANYLIQQLNERSAAVLQKQPAPGTESTLISAAYRSLQQNGVKDFLDRLQGRGILNGGFKDFLTIPVSAGFSDALNYTAAGITGIELQYNGDFSHDSGGWLNNYNIEVSNLNGDSGDNMMLSTEPILMVGKTYRVQVQVLDVSLGNTITNNGILLFTATVPDVYTFDFFALNTQLIFNLKFTNVSIREVLPFSNYEPVSISQPAGTSLPQINQVAINGPYYLYPGITYMLLINESSTVSYTSATGTDTDIVSGLAAAINNADGEWKKVTASSGGTYLIVTSNTNNEPFVLEVVSLKKELLSLPSNHSFFLGYAEDYVNNIQTLAHTEYLQFTFPGRIAGNEGRIGGYTVEATDVSTYPYQYLGTETSQANGFFEIKYQLKKPFRQISYIQIALKENNYTLTSNTYSVQNGSRTVNTIYYYDSPTAPDYTSIADVVSVTGLSIPPVLSSFLFSQGITTLKQIRIAGGLKYIAGLPVPQNDPAVIALDAHADLNTISYDILANQYLINKGLYSLQGLNNMSRTDIVQLMSFGGYSPGGFKSLMIHTVSKIYGSMLQSLINGHRAAANTPSNMGKIPALDAVLEEQCICDDCDAAVSPLAYLTDLLNYTVTNVKYQGTSNTFAFLESKFYQNFKDLPHYCDAEENLICQQRGVVEILRRYIADPQHTPTISQLATLNKSIREYVVNSYRYLLESFGTTYEELRDVRVGNDVAERKAKLAKRLNIPYTASGPDAYDPFTTLFIDLKSDDLTEAYLEKVFGLIDTRRDYLCSGLKIGDLSNQVTRWWITGYSWNKNTSSEGFVYLSIDHALNQVFLYKNSSRDTDALVGIASQTDTNRYLIEAANESGLTGELFLTNNTENHDISISLIPMTTSWRLQNQRNLWQITDTASNPYSEHTIPVIEPDIIGPDDFRKPADPLNHAFTVWKNRRAWVDGQLLLIRAQGISIESILSIMDQPVTYIKFDSSTVSHAAFPVVLPYDYQLGLYQLLQDSSNIHYNGAVEEVRLYMNMNVQAFLRFFEIYRASMTNDTKAVIISNEVEAHTLTQQRTSVTYSGVKRGDVFTLILNDTNPFPLPANIVAYIASDGDTEIDVISGLRTLIAGAGGNWTSVKVLNTIPVTAQPMLIEALANNTPFTLVSKVLRSATDEELEDVYSILTQSRKSVFYTDWMHEENQSPGIRLNSADYWKSLSEPVPGMWPILKSPTDPLIDPEKIYLADLAESIIADAARALWIDRTEMLTAMYNGLQSKRESYTLDAAFEEAWGASYLPYTYPRTLPLNDIVFNTLDDVLASLNNLTDPEAIGVAENYIETVLYTTPDDFRTIMSVRAKNSIGNPDSVTKEEWANVYAILTTSYKFRVLYPSWRTEENGLAYWQIRKAQLPKWRADSSDRSLWQRSLQAILKSPVIDPDIIRPDFIKTLDTHTPAITLWNSRYTSLDNVFSQIKTDRLAQVNALTGFDFIINKYLVTTPASLLLIQLREQSAAGEVIADKLAQLNIDQEILEFLLNIRKLAQTDPAGILEDEWNEVYSILVQVDKTRTYSLWREEEIVNNVFLTPDFFVISDYSRQDFYTEDQQHIINRRRPENAVRDWLNNLQARIDQEQAIYDNRKKMIADSEEEYIKDLRDALILATDVGGTRLADKAKAMTDRLLVDMENNCCQKITRISQAIETLQGLFFSIRNGLIQDTYPGLNMRIVSDRFDDEWVWMGAYGNWRSAMFVTLYPENLLYPTYRTQQSSGFRTFAGILRDDTRLTPESVCKAAHDYFVYYEDICNLTLIASCSARTVSYSGYGCGSNQISTYRNLQHLFATGAKSGTVYWSAIDTDSTDEYAHSFWSPIAAFDNTTVTRFLGATPWAQTEKQNVVLVFAESLKEGKKQIVYARLNLDTNTWDDDVTELEIPTDETFNADADTIILNKGNELVKVSTIYLAVKRGDLVRVIELNTKGSELIFATTNVYDSYIKKVITNLIGFVQATLIYTEKIVSYTVVTKKEPKLKGGIGIMLNDALGLYNDVYVRTDTTIVYTTKVGEKIIGNQSISNYKAAFIWPDGDAFISNDKFYVLFNEFSKSSGNNSLRSLLRNINVETRYMVFDDNNQFTPFDNTFINELANSYVFANSSGKTFMLYQQFGNKNGIYLSEISRDANTQKIALDRNTEQRLTPNTSGPFSIHPGKPEILANYKVSVQTAYTGNQSLKRSGSDYIEEAYYFVPMLAALSLQNKGYYTQALDWFRLVYDYSVPVIGNYSNPRPRKIWYGLIAEEAFAGDIKRISNWAKDPINPHAVAESRQNSYTRYTVISIARCMIDFANSEFTKDDAETVPKARLLYEEAMELLREEQLVSEEANCQTVIDDLHDYSPEDSSWYEWQPVWLGIINDLYKISDKEVLNNTVSLIQAKLAGADALSVKMAYARDITDDAQESPEIFSDIGALIASNRVTTSDAMTRILQNGNIGNLAEDVAYKFGEQYLQAASLVTALPVETLERKDFYLSWFGDEPKNVTPIPSPNSYNTLVENYPVRNGMRNKAYYNYVAPSNEQILTLSIIRNPIKAVADYFGKTSLYLPSPNLAFCVPPNPVLNGLILEAEVNLFKIRNCMNIAGIVRELSPYAAPTDQFSGIPVATAGGGISTGNFGGTFRPSPHRFDVLIQRAKEQVQLAQQIESALLSMYEKADAENYSLMKAKQDLKVSQSNIKLQDLRLKEAYSGITLAQLQKDRVTISSDYYKGLLQGNSLSDLEQAALNISTAITASYLVASAASTLSTTFNAGNVAGFAADALSFTAQYMSQMASYERRRQEWQYQQDLTTADLKISDQQIKIANDQKNVVEQERQISVLQNSNAQATLDFLSNKFTNAELYEWMSKILAKVYSALLQQATSSALTASNQLRFERQQEIPAIIKNDYWEAPSNEVVRSSGSGGNVPDRRGLTASARLLQDVIQLDQLAFDTDKRRLELTKNISLVNLDPVAFQQFRENGSITFQTPMEIFDRDFPGHYLRLVKRVRVSVIALIPPVDGIKATLINPGVSYTVVDNTFQRVPVRRDPETVALTVAQNATGMFELVQQSSKLNPFESIGVDTFWNFSLPKASNFFDFSSIADVLFTIEYTALENQMYRNTVIENLDNTFDAARPYSFKNQFADQWYDLNSIENNSSSMTVSFDTLKTDFPANLQNVLISGLTLFFADGSLKQNMDVDGEEILLTFIPSDNSGTVDGKEPISKGNLISTSSGNAASWAAMLAKPVSGSWQLTIPPKILQKIRNEEISNMLFVIYYEGETAKWI